MQFTKTLAAFLIGGASLAGFVNAAPLTTSDTSDTSNAKRDAGSQLLARWNAPAGFSGVEMGHSGAQINFGMGLYTEGLVTCIGVVVTGTPSSPIKDARFMVHLSGP